MSIIETPPKDYYEAGDVKAIPHLKTELTSNGSAPIIS